MFLGHPVAAIKGKHTNLMLLFSTLCRKGSTQSAPLLAPDTVLQPRQFQV